MLSAYTVSIMFINEKIASFLQCFRHSEFKISFSSDCKQAQSILSLHFLRKKFTPPPNLIESMLDLNRPTFDYRKGENLEG